MNLQARAAEAVRYLRFADKEVRGRSPLYEEFARGVAADADILDFLLTLPEGKRQPNLLLASARHRFGRAVNWAGFRDKLLGDLDGVRSVILTHATQTNEPARCATLLPVLARLPQPLALIEVGASAGLCLLPDFYGYDFGAGPVRPEPDDPAAPVFACAVSAGTPVPAAVPRIIWRAGLDLHPLDVGDPEAAAWLETLVWPEQTSRLAGLRAAMAVARRIRPLIVKGDLVGDALPRLCREAPSAATLVIFHTAVLAYVTEPEQRQGFAHAVRSLCPYWVSNEAPGVFPEQAVDAGGTRKTGCFLMSVNGSPVAWTDPHGASLSWIG